MYNRNRHLIKAAAALLAMVLFLWAALYLPGSRSPSAMAAAGVPTPIVPGSVSYLPPTTVTKDQDGYTLWTVDWGDQSWCVPVSTLRYPFDLMGQDPTELADATLRLEFDQGAMHYHLDEGSGDVYPVWDDASWGVALNGSPPNDWQLVGAIEGQPSGGKHWTTSDRIPIDSSLLIDGENNVWLQQHDSCPSEPGCVTCACTCIELSRVQLRAAADLEIQSVFPEDDTRNLWFEQSKDSDIRVKFTTVVSANTVTTETFQVYYFDQDVNKVYVDGVIRKLSGTEYAFAPKQSLMDGVQYIAQVWGKTEAEYDDRDQWVKDVGGGPLEEGRRWVFWTIPQLQVKVVPVQVLEGMPLVQDKATVLRTFIRWDLKPNVFWKSQVPSIEVDDVTAVWVSPGTDSGAADWSAATDWKPVRSAKTALRKREYQVYTFAEESYTNREKWTSLDSVNYFGFTPHSTGSYLFTARVLVNDSRGVAHPFRGSVNVNVSSVRQFEVYLRAVAVGADYGKSGTVDLSTVIDQNLRGLLNLYPLSSVPWPLAASAMQYYTPTTSLWINNWSTVPAGGWPKQYLLEEMSTLCQRTTGCRAMVGLASPGWLVDGGLTLPEAAPWGALIRTDNIGPNRFVMAHEIGHLARFEHIEQPAGEGFNVATGADKRYSVDQDVFDFMAVDPVESSAKQLWISNWHYTTLGLWTGAWQSQSKTSIAGGVSTDPRLLVSGAITKTTGEVTLLPWYQMEPGEWQAPAAGPYDLVFLDSLGGAIAGYTRSFTVGTTFTPAGSSSPASAPVLEAGDRGMFAFTVPYPAAMAKVQIRRASDSAMLKEITVSTSAPTISINPPGGAAWHGSQVITWPSYTGTRYVAVDISTDNAATWEALAINLTDASFTIQTAALPNTTQARVRLAATDGLRTTTASAGPFTIDNPPLVGYVSPSPGATGVGVYERINAGFRDAMDPATINGGTFSLAGGPFGTVAGTVTYTAATRTATFTPKTPLAYATTYTARVTTGVHDSSGEALPAEKTWSFTTETDRMPPQPFVFTPVAGAWDVPRNGTLVVVWDQALNASTINTSTFKLATAKSSPVNGSVTYNAATRVATFTPGASLLADTIYIASLKAGIQDADGNTTQGDFNWSFTTGKDAVYPFGFTDTFVDYGVDANGDGLYEQLVIKVGIQITSTGAYTLGGTLADSDGAEITWARTGANLGPGEQFLDLVFGGSAMGGHGVDGPYALTGLMLCRTDGTSAQRLLSSVSRQNAYDTFAYKASQFPAPLRFSGLPDVWVRPGQALSSAFNVRSYAHHEVQSSDQLSYTLLANTDLRAGVTLESDGSVRVTPRVDYMGSPRADWLGSTYVTVRASGSGTTFANDQAQDSFRVTIGWPEQVFLPIILRNASDTPAQARSNWDIAFSDDFETSFGWTVWGSISIPPGGWYYWDRRDCLAYSGRYSAWPMGGGEDGMKTACGAAYPNTLNTIMVHRPSINLKYTSKAEFSMKVWTDLAAGDQICAMVTNDVVLDEYYLPGAQYYGVCRSGKTNGWEDLKLDLSQVPILGNLLGTEKVWVAVRFIANDSGSRPAGVYVDDAVVRLCPQGLTCEP